MEFTQEQFDDKLIEILESERACNLLDIPGVYEILSEYFNNEILSALENDSEEEEEEEEDVRSNE